MRRANHSDRLSREAGAHGIPHRSTSGGFASRYNRTINLSMYPLPKRMKPSSDRFVQQTPKQRVQTLGTFPGTINKSRTFRSYAWYFWQECNLECLKPKILYMVPRAVWKTPHFSSVNLKSGRSRNRLFEGGCSAKLNYIKERCKQSRQSGASISLFI